MNKEYSFWNDPSTTSYFESKPPDPRIVNFLNSTYVIDGTRALDLGCGGGRHSQLLAEKGYQVSSVDINPEMLNATSTRLQKLNLRSDVKHGSILDIPYDDANFSIVVATGVLHQAKDLQEYKEAIAELSRVTQEGGIVLLNIFTNSIWDETYQQNNSPHSIVTKEGLYMTLLSKDVFNQYMSANGFELLEEQGEDIKEENTGPRAVYRAFYSKRSL